MSGDENEELLRILNAHGQQFLKAFDASVLPAKRKSKDTLAADSTMKIKRCRTQAKSSTEEEVSSSEEWAGFSHTDEDGDESTENSDECHARKPNVVVFSDRTPGALPAGTDMTKAQKKAFMSSKVSKLNAAEPARPEMGSESESEDDDLTNAQNDALLHRLVHTQILSASLNPDLDLTSAQRRKALAGRVLESAGQAKFGKGEASVRSKERDKHAKRVRDGLLAKQKERREKELEEAKNMGNYHPVLKQLFDVDSSANQKQKRERGLRMGIGSYSGGILRLKKSDIASVSGQRQSSRSVGRKGGRRK